MLNYTCVYICGLHRISVIHHCWGVEGDGPSICVEGGRGEAWPGFEDCNVGPRGAIIPRISLRRGVGAGLEGCGYQMEEASSGLGLRCWWGLQGSA